MWYVDPYTIHSLYFIKIILIIITIINIIIIIIIIIINDVIKQHNIAQTYSHMVCKYCIFGRFVNCMQLNIIYLWILVWLLEYCYPSEKKIKVRCAIYDESHLWHRCFSLSDRWNQLIQLYQPHINTRTSHKGTILLRAAAVVCCQLLTNSGKSYNPGHICNYSKYCHILSYI